MDGSAGEGRRLDRQQASDAGAVIVPAGIATEEQILLRQLPVELDVPLVVVRRREGRARIVSSRNTHRTVRQWIELGVGEKGLGHRVDDPALGNDVPWESNAGHRVL